MKTEIIYKNAPFTLKILRDNLEGYVLNCEAIHIFEVDKNKLRETIITYIESLQQLLEVLQK
jgi:hypothetical protein